MTGDIEILPPDVDRWGDTEFVPGRHVGLVSRSTVALIEAGHPVTRERLWSLIAVDAPIDDVLDELSSTGLKSLPAFAVAQLDSGALRLVARGATHVTVTFSDGDERIVDPSDVRTWREDVFVGVGRVSLGLDDEETSTEHSDRFFVLAGSVPASSLERRFDEVGQLAAAAAASWTPQPPLVQPIPGIGITPGADDLLPAAGHRVDSTDRRAPGAEAETTSTSDERSDGGPETVDAAREDPTRLPEVAPTLAETDDVERDDAEAETASDQPFGSPPPGPAAVSGHEPAPGVEGSFPPEDSNETISSIDFSGPVSAPETTTSADEEDNYDFIYGHTVARSVEGAAVRIDDEEVGSGGLISSVPGEAPVTNSGSSDAVAALEGDHDGLTVSRAELAAMKGVSGAAAQDGNRDEVLAVMCSSGHPNAPHAASCRVCGAAIATSSPVAVQRPPLGVLVFSNGERVVADRTVLIGRNPRVSGTLTGELPRIVKLESAGQGLSRTHAEVRIEGWQMLLEDLQSTNGTEVTLPGQAPRRLHAGDPVALVAGATVDFGEELQCRVEVVS